MRSASRHRHGVSLIYAAFAITGIGAMVSLTVDLARVRVAKYQLQCAVDAAARAAAAKIDQPSSTCKSAAVAVAAENSVDGTAVSLSAATDIDIGVWNHLSKSFTITSTSPNAVRVRGARTAARGNPITLLFAPLIGRNTCDVIATSIAVMNATEISSTHIVDGKSNMYAAKMTNTSLYDPWGGEMVNDVAATGVSIPVVPGQQLTFTSSGSVSYQYWQGDGSYTSPEGGQWGVNLMYPDNHPGMADMIAPATSLCGVFTTDATPSGSRPATLDFSTFESRDYTSLTPTVCQPFFIGDGRTSAGAVQTIIVPPGATRLYLGVNDSVAWRDNGGNFTVTTTIKRTVLTVQ